VKDKARGQSDFEINNGKLRTEDSAYVMYWDQDDQASFWQFIKSDEAEDGYAIKHRYWGWGVQENNIHFDNNCFLAVDDTVEGDIRRAVRDTRTLNLHINKDESKSLIWKYVGYTDLRLTTLDYYYRKIDMDLKSRSKQMDIFEIFNQLKQTKFDAGNTI